MLSAPILHRTITLILISIILSACVTIPEATKEEKELQGTLFDSYKSIMEMIESKKLNPYQIDVKLGEEYEGYLREENPQIIYPVVDDPVELDSFQTYINVWQFEGVKDKKVDIILRSFSTFPTGMFFPYFILVDKNGKPLVRQTKITAMDKEMVKSQSVKAWTEDFILPYSGIYYIFVICDVTNLGKDPHLVRLGNERVPVPNLYENISTSTFKPLAAYKPNAKIGKYELKVETFD